MRILFLGDIVGKSGRQAVCDQLPALRRTLDVDCVIVNGENAASHNGINEKIAAALFDAGVDAITTGNHAFGVKDSLPLFETEARLLRPLNYPPQTPGRGHTIIHNRNNQKILVINPHGQVFMDAVDNPFHAVDNVLQHYKLGRDVAAIFVDMHAEATSEKYAMGFHLDGRVTAVMGTHTHVPTADCRILPQGTAYQTDTGMCADYNSILGVDKNIPLIKFMKKIPTDRKEQTNGPATLCGALIDSDDKTGLATRIQPLVVGPHLINTMPAV